MADRIVVMNHGVIEQVGTPAEIYREPATLFVADFIGAMNKLPAVVEDADRVLLGAMVLQCRRHPLAPGAEATLAIRPEDVVPVEGNGAGSGNRFPVTIAEMEFLGSFWRARLVAPALGDGGLEADFSVNAIRRLGLDEGRELTVELPVDRLHVFDGALGDDLDG